MGIEQRLRGCALHDDSFSSQFSETTGKQLNTIVVHKSEKTL